MSLFVDTTSRSNDTELMDDFSMKGELLRDTLDKLGAINKWLGGNRVTLNGLRQLLEHQPKEKVYTIVDIGCGHGDILRLIAEYGRKHNYSFQLIGIDANQDAIDYAVELSTAYDELSFKKLDVFSRPAWSKVTPEDRVSLYSNPLDIAVQNILLSFGLDPNDILHSAGHRVEHSYRIE